MKDLLILIVFLFAFNNLIYAQTDDFLQKYQERFAKKPKDLTFELRFKENKKQFRQGEIISLELAFSSSAPNKFVFNTSSYDRSGRSWIDGFIIDKPDGAADPLKDYFTKSFLGFLGGSLFTTPMLGERAQIIERDLNEWLRFDKAGKYRLFVSSGRVSIGEPYRDGSESISAISNIIEFEIIAADKNWQQTKLSEIVKNLSPSLPEATRKQACLELRFLGTEAAAKEIIQRFTDEDEACDFSFYMGLQGSPQRKFIVAEMERTMERAEFPVSYYFVQNLALLSYFLQNPKSLADFPPGDEASSKAWEAELKIQQTQRQAEVDRYADRLELALKEKKGKVLAVSTDTLFRFRKAEKSAGVTDLLLKVIWDLSPERLRSLLEYDWEKIKTPKMLPILREIYIRFDKQGLMADRDRQVLEIAVKRIYELAPDEGRDLILKELRRTHLRVDNEILLLLPDKEFPEFENAWIEQASDQNYSDSGAFVELLEKYGTPGSLPRMRAVYEERIGRMTCRLQENLIRYFLKHSAEFGTDAVRKAMKERGKTMCYNSVFENIREKYWSKEIEQIAVSHLNDENIGVVKSAADVLGKYGSIDVKEKLRQRFEEFSRQIKADPAALKKTFGDYSYPLETIERSFIQALNESPNWKLTAEEKSKLAELCVSKSCRNEIDTVFEIDVK